MAIYKIFPTKDTSLYTISKAMNTGLDEILEASTYLEQSNAQVSRYLLEFSQPEINEWVNTYISGSGVTVINSDTAESIFLFDQTMVEGPTYPTSSDGKGKNSEMAWDLIPSSSTGNGRGQHFNVQANGSYFIPNRNIVDTLVITPSFTANDGTYGPFIISNDDVQNTVTTSSLSASINLVVKDNKVISAPIVNNGSASYVSQDYFSYLNNNDLYLTPAAVTATVGGGVFVYNATYPNDTFYFKIGEDDLVTTIDVIEGIQPYGIGYNIGDKLVFKSESFAGFPFSDDITITLPSPAVSSSNWSNREFGVDLRNSAAVVNGLNIDQELKIYPVSGSWGMGSGKFDNRPQSTDGASWEWRTYSGSDAGAQKWAISGSMTTSTNQQILSTTTGTSVGSLLNIAGNGSQGGTGAQFTIAIPVGNLTIQTVTCTTAGVKYIQGDTITILAADLTGGTLGVVSTDLIFKVTAVDGFGAFSVASYSGSSAGGGNWYTGSNLGLPVIQSQSFSYGIGVDLSVDVTDTIKTWYTNSLVDNTIGFTNNGFLVKQSSSKEFINSQAVTATFKYFSVDTNTIYPPLLDLKWNDHFYDTGSSINTIIGTPEAFMSIYNNNGTYYSESVERFRIAAIPKYPDIVYQTASLYTTNYYLPKESSSYAIKDADTNEFVIPFDDTYTKISADSTSSYFDIYMNGLEPERYYTILIKTIVDGTTHVFDQDTMFRVING